MGLYSRDPGTPYLSIGHYRVVGGSGACLKDADVGGEVGGDVGGGSYAMPVLWKSEAFKRPQAKTRREGKKATMKPRQRT